MGTVHLLDTNTINKIAAGEVVERPASVVKELAENAIDAGAQRIEVEIQGGGTSLIRVTDDGKGMSMEDAKLAIQRHATSKIREASDLFSIGTLGFRGEALPTIASVSRFSMRTRQEGSELGALLRILGGKEEEIRETGCALGTTIQVEDLFFNTPARKKFLKTNHTEGARITDFLVKLALSHPEIEFRLTSGSKASMATPGNGNLKDAIRSIYGKQTAEALLEIGFEDEGIRIGGYITKPNQIKSSRTWQTYIVNGRIIQSRMLAKAIDNAYAAMVPKSGFPLAVLQIEVPKRSIDVNVHPQKSEIKFEDEGRVFKAVYKAVADAVRPSGQNLGNVAASVPKAERHYTQYTMEPMQFIPPTAPTSSYGFGAAGEPMRFREAQEKAQAMLHRPGTAGNPAFQREPSTSDSSAASMNSMESFGAAGLANAEKSVRFEALERPAGIAETAKSAESAEPNSASHSFRDALAYDGEIVPIGQVDRCYIIAQDAKGLYIADQHAAHERILFDRFSAMADGIPSQQLLVHLLLSFDRREAELVEENRELFRGLGFTLEPSGEREFRLMEVPADIPVGEAENILREILMDLQDQHKTSPKEIRQACIATTACRAAIKAGEELSLRQMQILLEELSRTAYPYTCPHGRPTILKFSSDELAKMFKRTGF